MYGRLVIIEQRPPASGGVLDGEDRLRHVRQFEQEGARQIRFVEWHRAAGMLDAHRLAREEIVRAPCA